MPDSITFIIESRWGLGTLLYLLCRYMPFCFLLLKMLEAFQRDASSTLCHSYFVANTCIFIVRAYAVWEKKFKVLTTISIIAFMTPIIICFQEMTSSVSGECWIQGLLDIWIRWQVPDGL
ncbi:hypothetical protein AZE42_05311 [Rhizopogon vesiculosus]|uniref:Uncharacterized protein n=1 Tax=Rhizopogon vesiculosus TaxID=180088 RepID=A0A1J8QXI4_9AGAM|nr:hypothetical protein AZE42_05311 [Rhizopogon vesiculosus]